jgi:hypothetical protein
MTKKSDHQSHHAIYTNPQFYGIASNMSGIRLRQERTDPAVMRKG